MRRMVTLAGAALLAATVLVACGDDSGSNAAPGDTNSEAIVLDAFAVASLSGDAEPYGTAQTNGIALAVDELSGADVVINLETLDDESVPEGGVTAVQQAVDAGASAILGPTLSPVAAEADPIAVDAGIPVFGVTNSTLDLTDLDTVWRICKSEDQQIDATVRWAAVEDTTLQAALLVDSSDGYAVGAGDSFESSATGVGWAVERFDADGVEAVATTVTTALDTNPDILLIAARSEAALAFARETVDFDGQRLGSNGYNGLEVFQAGGDAVEGIVVSASWNLEHGRTETPEFVAAYEERFGLAPDAFAAQGYAAVQVLVAAARQAGSGDAAAIQDALENFEATDTVLGSFEFHVERSPTYLAIVQIVENGVLVPAAGAA